MRKKTRNVLVCFPHDNNKVTEFRCHKKSIDFVQFFFRKCHLFVGVAVFFELAKTYHSLLEKVSSIAIICKKNTKKN